jgi:Ser/Thr protein kinase RdoA (MazF antagonist)
MYDLAVALAHCIGTKGDPGFRDALFKGFAEHRSVPSAQFAQLDLFTAAFYVYYDLWVIGGTYLHPEYLTKEMEEMMYRGPLSFNIPRITGKISCLLVQPTKRAVGSRKSYSQIRFQLRLDLIHFPRSA